MSRCSRGRLSRRLPAPAEDAGVIAIVVALSVSTFVLGFAALAVDLGSAYVRKAELQSVANRLALAGAKGLPTVVQPEGAIDQIDQALRDICRNDAVPGVCVIASDGTGSAPNRGWMTDGQPANGEVTFFSDPNGDTKYDLRDRVTDLALSSVATAVQVKLAPSKVEFGLAGALGADSATLTKSATGRVGTPLGSGILPFALQPGDLTNGQFCVRDPAFPLNPTPGAPRPRLWPVTLSVPPNPDGSPQFPDGIPPNLPNQTIRIKLTTVLSSPDNPLSNVFFHATNSTEVLDYTEVPGSLPGEYLYDVKLPEGAPGTSAQIWATGRELVAFRRPRNFVSSPSIVFYDGELAPDADLCQEPSSDRGFVQLARPGSGSQLEDLEKNVRTSPAVNLFPTGGLLGTLGTDLDCLGTAFSAPATTCLSMVPGVGLDDALTNGLLDSSGPSPGRLIGDCGNGTGSFGVDDSRIFEDPGFIDTRKGGSADALRSRLSGATGDTAAGPTNRGWLTSHALQCPRLAVMPVIDPDSVIGTINGRNITGFRYVWIDDDLTSTGRGLHFTRGQVDSFRGYVVDPAYLPATVAGSKLIGPYLGDDMPKQVQLIPDLGGRAT